MSLHYKHNPNQTTLAIHSTENSFGFAFRKDNNIESDNFFLRKVENDLCNNLVVDFNQFMPKDDLQNVNKISVSIGPANFNSSRLVVVLARTISQQINCSLSSFSSFEIISKRIASKNNILNSESFWIYKQLKRKGFIAGKYRVCASKKQNENISISEIIVPKFFEELNNTEPKFEANYDDKKDLTELLNLSNNNLLRTKINSWEKVLPLYPLSPTN